ncbi:MAG: ABC transporter ATP-binding protein [Anaerolineae bacterium]
MHIELNKINKFFGSVHANQDISITFGEGRIIGILGENGAGKSTLMKILSGYQPPSSGEIIIDGHAVQYDGPIAAIAHGIGMLQQDPLDVGAFTVLENFVFGRAPRSWWGRWFDDHQHARQQLSAITERFGFQLDPNLLISELSIAQRQQLEIVRLLAQDIRLLILDEPTTGISTEQKSLLFDVLRTMVQEGMTILLVSHKLEEVISLCDEVAVLRAGAIVGTRQMPATKVELVQLMFGADLPTPQRQHKDLNSQAVLLNMQDVAISAGRLQMTNINLSVRRGEIIGLAGLDGSGQELIMRGIAGLHPLDNGAITLYDVPITGLSYHQCMQHGLIFCASGRIEEGLIAGLTLTEHVALTEGSGIFIDWQRAQADTRAKIQAYDVRGTPDNAIEQLSGGNQQRVLMSLVPELPGVMLLEQPMRGLDVDSAVGIWDKLLERCEAGSALIFSSPDLDELLTYSDRILVCYAGETYLIDDPANLTSNQLGYLIGGEFERVP